MKRNKFHTFISLFFFLLFLVPAGYKILLLNYPIISRSVEDLWTFELKIKFQGKGTRETIRHFLPKNELGQTVLNENFVSEYFYFITEKQGPNISVKWKGKGSEGETQLFYRASIETAPKAFSVPAGVTDEKYSPQIFQYLFLAEMAESVNVELYAFLNALLEDDATKAERIRSIYDFLTQEVETVTFTKDTGLVAPIETKKATLAQKRKLLIHLARMADIPARSVHGIFLEEGTKRKALHNWAEVYLQGSWVPIDIELQLFARLPENLLIVYRGDESFMTTTGVKDFDYSYTVFKEKQWAFSQFYATTALVGSTLHEWSLFVLPIETQQVFRLILMIPLGALIVSIFRNIVGIATFGTFMPVLISLAFRNTKLAWGITLFAVVVMLGLLSRWYMDRLKLLLVPRLSVIVTVLVIILSVASVIGQHVGVYRIMAVALFPMIIMTMTIERLSILIMERGGVESLKVSVGTLVVSVCTYFAISSASVQDFFFAFPEVLFGLIAVQILIGRYTGYRLTEYFRFFPFIKSDKEKPSHPE